MATTIAAPPATRRYLVLAICCMSLFVVGLDNTIVNVALPTLHEDLGASVSGLQWVVDAYTLVLASLLMLSGSTADRVGRARTFKVGLALFGLGSLLCSTAPSVGFLIAARMVQAIGGSMLNPVAMSIIRTTFTDPRERAQAIGLWGGVVGLSLALGPILGGALVQGVSWRAIFWVNVPVVVVALALTARFVPESRAPQARRPDPVGQLLVLALLACVTYAIIEAPTSGWASAQTLGLFAAAAAALAALVTYESRRRDPLIELRFFRSVPFSGATLIAICAFVGLSGFLFLTTLELQQARGLSPLAAGLRLLPMAVATLLIAPVSGRWVGRYGPRPSLVLGGVGMAAGALLLTGTSATTPDLHLLGAYLVFGIGFGAVNAPITATAVSGMPPAQAGVAAAIASTSRQVGAALGIAVVGAVAVAGGGSGGASLTPGGATGWWILTAAGVGVLLLGLLTTTARAQATAAAVGDLG